MSGIGKYCFTLMVLTAVLAAFLSMGRAQEKPAAPDAQSKDVSGTWKWSVQGPGGEVETVLTLKQDGEKLTGTITGFGDESPIADGKYKDGEVTFKVVRNFNGNQITTLYTGKIADGALKGKSETIFAQNFEAKRSQ